MGGGDGHFEGGRQEHPDRRGHDGRQHPPRILEAESRGASTQKYKTNIRTFSAETWSVATIVDPTVEDTWCPTNAAPKNSKIDAMIWAPRSEMAPDPTAIP